MNSIGYFTYYMYQGHKNQDTYIPLCILEYKEAKKHYQLLYYNKNFSEDIFFEECEENNDNLKEMTNMSKFLNFLKIKSLSIFIDYYIKKNGHNA